MMRQVMREPCVEVLRFAFVADEVGAADGASAEVAWFRGGESPDRHRLLGESETRARRFVYDVVYCALRLQRLFKQVEVVEVPLQHATRSRGSVGLRQRIAVVRFRGQVDHETA